jgi:LuxR family maltose regulon positive regulatory protein
VIAPAGYGKTTLLSEWVAQSSSYLTSNSAFYPSVQSKSGTLVDRPGTSSVAESFKRQALKVAWLSLDKADNDALRFLTYLVAAVNKTQPELAVTARKHLDGPVVHSSLYQVLTLFLNEISEFPDHLTVVLDDYHLIETSAVHHLVEFMLDNLPPQLHLVIATRSEPPLPLARWRVRHQLIELHAADLQFSQQETELFLNVSRGLKLSQLEIERFWHQTEGWAAALQLIALSIQNQPDFDVTSFVASFDGKHRFILDYLIEEVFRGLPQETQTFLRQTSLLSSFNAALCEAVTQTTAAQATLESLERANLFITPLDHTRQWYRYHPLFAEALYSQLKRYDPQQLPELHCRASEWYAGQGLLTEAVEHALAGEAFEQAATLIQQAGYNLLMQGEANTIQQWFEQLPSHYWRSNSNLSVLRAWALVAGSDISDQLALTEEELDQFEQAFWDQEDRTGKQEADGWQTELDLLRKGLGRVRKGWRKTTKLSSQALKDLPSKRTDLRGFMALSRGIIQMAGGHLPASTSSLAEAIASYQASGNQVGMLVAQGVLAGLLVQQGQLRQAASFYQLTLEAANSSQASPQAARRIRLLGGPGYTELSHLLYEWNELERAESYAHRGIQLSKELGRHDFVANGYLTLARLQLTQLNQTEALKFLEAMGAELEQAKLPEYAAALKARSVPLWLKLDHLDRAIQWQQQSGLNPIGKLAKLPRDTEYLALARLLIARNEYDTALNLLERLAQATLKGGRTGSFIEVLLLQSLAEHALRPFSSQAITTLMKSLTLAEPQGYLRLFVDEAPLIAKLLEQPLASSLAEYLTRIKAVSSVPTPASSASAPQTVIALPYNQNLVEPLSARELEILKLVADGLSNQQIAQRLVIGTGTVKTHLINIYGKLEAHNRTLAVAQARKLGLL